MSRVGKVILSIVLVLMLFFSSSITTLPVKQAFGQLSSLDLGFTFDSENALLRNDLKSIGINLSSPLQFSNNNDIMKYCNFLSDPTKQALIQDCTSTELKDENGNFLLEILT